MMDDLKSKSEILILIIRSKGERRRKKKKKSKHRSIKNLINEWSFIDKLSPQLLYYLFLDFSIHTLSLEDRNRLRLGKQLN